MYYHAPWEVAFYTGAALESGHQKFVGYTWRRAGQVKAVEVSELLGGLNTLLACSPPSLPSHLLQVSVHTE